MSKGAMGSKGLRTVTIAVSMYLVSSCSFNQFRQIGRDGDWMIVLEGLGVEISIFKNRR